MLDIDYTKTISLNNVNMQIDVSSPNFTSNIKLLTTNVPII